MAVSVETLSGLERKMTISVPAEKFEEQVALRLKNLTGRVKIDGFRPGKAPFHLVKQRYSESVREEVARDLIQSTLYDGLREQNLIPAGTPNIVPGPLASGQDFSYDAFFEVFPEITIKELENQDIEVWHATVTDADVDALIEKLREQNKVWNSVSRPVAMHDRIVIDFEGFMDNQPMSDAKEYGYEMVVGAGNMIPGFEDGLVGAEIDVPVELHLTFPEQYHEASLAGKPARFVITVREVKAGDLPALDDAFAALFNIQEGGVDALKKDVKQNMERELQRRLSNVNRERIFDLLLNKNTFDVPSALVEQEIGNLKHEMYHRIFGHEHSEHEKIPDFPRVLFEDQAVRRVRLGLLFADYVKKHALEASKERVDEMIEQLATAYDNPEELRQWYHQKPERMAEIESLVMEEIAAEKMIEQCQKVMVEKTYDSVMNPPKTAEVSETAQGE
jgi:trigger factor